MSDRVPRREDDAYAAGHFEARSVLKRPVDGRRLEALDYRTQLGPRRQHLRPRETRPLGAIDEWHLDLMRQHQGAAGFYHVVQRTDVVDVLVGDDDASQVGHLDARRGERAGDLFELPRQAGVHESVAMGWIQDQARVVGNRLTVAHR